MSVDLSTTLRQLNIETLEELCCLSARSLARNFDQPQLNSLANALRSYLWEQDLLSGYTKVFSQQQLPLEALGLTEKLQRTVEVNHQIRTVTEFINRDASEHITAHWTAVDRLALRIRIFSLLLLSPEQLKNLKSSPMLVQKSVHSKISEQAAKYTLESEDDEFATELFLHQPWLWDKMPEDFTRPPPFIDKILFEDVYQLPIATSRRHEIWAGVQMKATERLEKVVKQHNNVASPKKIFVEVYQEFYANWQHLEDLCATHQLPLPNCVVWANEILMVRKDFFHLPRSRLRHFIRTIEKSNGEQELIDEVVAVAFDTFELLFMTPSAGLRFIRRYGQEMDGILPPVEAFDTWSKETKDQKTKLKMLLKQGVVARNKLVSGYFRSVLKFARKYAENEDALDYYLDLVQEGAIGLITAADKFDYRTQARFITYATSWIWQATGRAIGDLTRTIRIPTHRQEQLKQLEKAYQLCAEETEQTPTAKYLCLYLELLDDEDTAKVHQHLEEGTPLPSNIRKKWDEATQKTQQLLEYIEPTVSLSSEIPAYLVEDSICLNANNASLRLFEIIYDGAPPLDHAITLRSLKEFISGLTDNQLSARGQQIINLRFGLKDGDERTLEEIGQQFGLTRERIRQIESKILGQWRELIPRIRNRLEEYYYDLDTIEPPQLTGETQEYIDEMFGKG